MTLRAVVTAAVAILLAVPLGLLVWRAQKWVELCFPGPFTLFSNYALKLVFLLLWGVAFIAAMGIVGGIWPQMAPPPG
jgi:hypothetical protein